MTVHRSTSVRQHHPWRAFAATLLLGPPLAVGLAWLMSRGASDEPTPCSAEEDPYFRCTMFALSPREETFAGWLSFGLLAVVAVLLLLLGAGISSSVQRRRREKTHEAPPEGRGPRVQGWR